MPRVLLLTGTCGSGKSTIAARLGARPDWAGVFEDVIWDESFGKNRGAFGSEEHRHKRRLVEAIVFDAIRTEHRAGRSVALDATVHESPPEVYEEYRAFFQVSHLLWALRVLHPTLEVAVARDAARAHRPMGAERVAELRRKFTGLVFAPEWFLDTSLETPEETVVRLVAAGVA